MGIQLSNQKIRAAVEALESRVLLSTTSGVLSTGPEAALPARQVENLNRGLVAINKGGSVYLSWRLLGNDAAAISFNVYRSANGAAATKLNASPITLTTDYNDTTATLKQKNAYYIRPVISGVEQSPSETFTLGANSPASGYLSFPLQIPPAGVNPVGEAYTYSANDTSVGDVDGDGEYEYIVKWDPSNSKDNSQSGYTGNTYLDAYKIDGTRLWRIDLGQNIRAGAHYTQFIVYDLDGDGKAEVATRTAPGTKDGQGNWVLMGSDNPATDYRNTSGYNLTSPEYITIFNGLTGAAMINTAMNPNRGNVNQWGDTYGNRVDRILMAVAYLDGVRPSLVVARGIFPGQSGSVAVRNEIVAYNYRNNALSQLWWFKAAKNINSNINSAYVGQGTYDMIPADVDGDGKDEIMYGAVAIDDNGAPLYNTALGHGDAMHVSDMDPSNPGLEVFMPHETASEYVDVINGVTISYGGSLRDAATGQLLHNIDGHGADVGRGVAFDVDPTHAGYEMWQSADGNLYNVDGSIVSAVKPNSQNFGVWWDADPLRELLDGNRISKWNWTTTSTNTVLTMTGASSNNGTKSTPNLSGDVMGDWREEVIERAVDSSEMRIYTTTIPATSRMVTLMHDVQYREAIAWQNVGYNQPPHPSFFLGNGMTTPPAPSVYYASATPAFPAVPGNLLTNVVASTQINLQWDAVAGATGYRVKRSNNSGGPFYTIAASVLTPSFADSTVERGGNYFYVVSALNASGESADSTAANALLPLPAPWVPADIGNVDLNGSTTYRNGVFTVVGSGLTGQTLGDAMRFVSQNVSGDASIIARVDTKTDAVGAGGVMFRKSSASNAAFAAVVATDDSADHVFFYYRSTDGGAQSYFVLYHATPVWLKMTRAGNNFSAFMSDDGVTWTQVGSTRAITMGTAVPAGLCVTAWGGSVLASAKFSNVGIATTSVAPSVLSSVLQYQLSPNEVEVGFNEDVSVSLSLADVTVQNLSAGSGVTPTSLVYEAGINVANIVLPTNLADGNYRVTLAAAGIADANAIAMAADYSYDFFILNGDANRDRFVDTTDFNILAANFGGANRVFSQGDFNFDMSVNSTDFNAFVPQYGKRLAPASAPALSSLSAPGPALFRTSAPLRRDDWVDLN